MNIGKLIQKAMMVDGIDKKQVAEIIAESIEKKDNENEAYIKLYDFVYGDTLCREKCEEWVDNMTSGSEHGQKWTMEEVESVASRLDVEFTDFTKYEFYAVIHMMYYDYKEALKVLGVTADGNSCARLALAWFNDEDAPSGKTKKYYFNILSE